MKVQLLGVVGMSLGPPVALVMLLGLLHAAQGLVMSKCELKSRLEEAMAQMRDDDDDMMKGPFKMDDCLAKIVCKVEHSTNFNTSTVKFFDIPRVVPLIERMKALRTLPAWKPPPIKLPPWFRRPVEGDPNESSGSEVPEDSEDGPSQPMMPLPPWKPPPPVRLPAWSPLAGRTKRALGSLRGGLPPMKPLPWGRPLGRKIVVEEEEEEEEEDNLDDTSTWTLYGIFQLADRVVCESDGLPSMNLCQMPCTDLLDDDITDDLACVQELKKTHDVMKMDPEYKFLALSMKAKMMAMMFPRKCMFAMASNYFAECQ